MFLIVGEFELHIIRSQSLYVFSTDYSSLEHVHTGREKSPDAFLKTFGAHSAPPGDQTRREAADSTALSRHGLPALHAEGAELSRQLPAAAERSVLYLL